MTSENSELAMFLETTEAFIAKTADLSTVRQPADGSPSVDRSWWAAAAELGWMYLSVAEECGGGSVSGRGVVDLSALLTVLGRSAAPGPLIPTTAILAALTHDDSTIDAPVEDIMSGQVIAAWVSTDLRAGSDGQVRVKPGANGHVLQGSASGVEFGGEADVFLVDAADDQGAGVIALVSSDSAGVRVLEADSLDLARPTATVTFDGATLDESQIVATGAPAVAIRERQMLLAQLLQAAETVGVVDAVYDMTTQWAFDRYSFGRPLASYQALKHRFADMKVWLEGSRAIVAAAAESLEDDRADARILVSAAKSYVGDRSVQIIQESVQLHGGVGVTMEHPLHIYLRRATVNRMTHGTPRQHRELVAHGLGL